MRCRTRRRHVLRWRSGGLHSSGRADGQRRQLGRAVLLRSSGGNDNQYLPREYDVALAFSVSQADVVAVIEDVSHRAHCPGCSPAGIELARATSQIKADALGYTSLYIYYPQFTHTTDGYVLYDTRQSVELGVASKSVMTVTNSCTRASILSKDGQTEYAVLFQY